MLVLVAVLDILLLLPSGAGAYRFPVGLPAGVLRSGICRDHSLFEPEVGAIAIESSQEADLWRGRKPANAARDA